MIALAGCMIAGCGSPDRGLAVAEPLGIPFDRHISSFAWLGDGTVIVSTSPDGLAFWRPGGGIRELQPIVPPDLDCRIARYSGPVKLSSGAAGVVRACLRDTSVVRRNDQVDLVELDLESGNAQVIVQVAPLVRGMRYGTPQDDYETGEVEWSSEHQSAFITIGDAICPTIAELKPDGVHLLDVAVGSGEDYWRFGGDPDPATCEQGGRATAAAVSPGGGRLAFFGSEASAGVGGPGRIGAPGALYVTNRKFEDPTPVIAGVTYVQSLVWLDEDRLAVSAETVDGAEGPGLWLVDTRTGKSTKLFDNTLDSLAVSPQGNEIAGVDRVKGEQDRLVKFPIPK